MNAHSFINLSWSGFCVKVLLQNAYYDLNAKSKKYVYGNERGGILWNYLKVVLEKGLPVAVELKGLLQIFQ